MPAIRVKVKHAGKVYDDDNLVCNTDLPPKAFKQSIYERTGVPLERMKVMVKGGTLKDDSDWTKVAPKLEPGHTFMVIGAAGELPKAPEKPIVFMEDMAEDELAQTLDLPVGFNNLGNTCYMNATLQVLRAVPELQTALTNFRRSEATSHGNAILSQGLQQLFTQLKIATGPYTPLAFLTILRQVVPQFGEMARVGKSGSEGYAQQDAEECWTQLTNSLQAIPGSAMDGSTSSRTFIEQYMMGDMKREMRCEESPDEEPTISYDPFLKLECNITSTTNFLHTGIMEALDQEIEKTSPSLGRQAKYIQSSRISRLPSNLTVHMVRFAWKREIGKKAKIMRRVAFPQELDILDLCTPELQEKLLPANKLLKDVERDRRERRKVRKRTKTMIANAGEDVEMGDASRSGSSGVAAGPPSPVLLQTPVPVGSEPLTADEAAAAAGTSTSDAKGKGREDGSALEPESVYRKREYDQLQAAIPAEVREDVGSSATGLYELVGIVTHKGASANSGHYIGFVKKSAMMPVNIGGEAGKPGLEDGDEDWLKFDDEKVSVFPAEKLNTLEGGGEDASAYLLLYRSKSLA